MTSTEWLSIFGFIIAAYFALHSVVFVVSRYLKLDKSEKEQALQAQIDQLTSTVVKYESEVADLRKQVKIVVVQYEEVVGKYQELLRTHEEAQHEAKSLREQLNNISNGYSMRESKPDRVLLVLVGSEEKGLSLDLASIRAVRTETGMEVQVISNPSPDNLKKALDRARMKQDHIYLHMAIKADKDGYQLGDQIVDATWLSSVLNGVIVLVVAGTDSDAIGDFLGVVPYVVSMDGGVAHRDASIFARLFWSEIGKGMGPSLAIRRAMDRSPGTIREKIISHWDW